MFKTTALIFVFLTLVSCGNSDNKASRIQKEESSDSISSEEIQFKTNIKLVDFDQDQEIKVMKATELIRRVVTSDKFKTKVLGHKFNGKFAYSDSKGLSNAEIYRRILDGSETIKPRVDNEMDMVLLTYYEDVITIGHTYPTTRNVWMNRKYFDRFTSVQVTGNMMHEWLHKLGFDHEVQNSPTRKFSVPYAVGYMVQRLAREMDQN